MLRKYKIFYKFLKLLKIFQEKYSFTYCVNSFLSIRFTRILVKAKKFYIDNKSLVKLNIAPPLFQNYAKTIVFTPDKMCWTLNTKRVASMIKDSIVQYITR